MRRRRSSLLAGAAAVAGTAVFAVLAAGCGTDDEPIYVDDGVIGTPDSTVPVVVPATTQPVVGTSVDTSTVASAGADIAGSTGDTDEISIVVVERAFSPENAVAEISGVGAVAGDPVTVDDRPADVRSFETFVDGSFVVRVWIEDEGAHTVCVRDACSRVFTRAPDADTPEEVEAMIDAARPIAASIFDGEALLPGWTIEVAGPLAGTGGSTDVERRVVTVYANRDRTVEEFVVTILHEWGHAVDAELLTDEDRVEFRRRRGFDEAEPWRQDGAHTVERWATQPGEDFAEVMAVAWLDAAATAETASPIDHTVRSGAPAGDPDADTLAFVLAFAPSS